ncbi:hypothetical protein ACLS0R_17715 [Comamonas jiangduensis]|uniref:hypothetical protein n=1 Tax=Comamonas jiangduensis TaxID=1194168 RepID=UPI003BF88F63
MIGTMETNTISGVHIQAVAHEGLSVTINGRPGTLAILNEQGQVVATGKAVAQETEAVAINCYKSMLRGQGHLRTLSAPIATQNAA